MAYLQCDTYARRSRRLNVGQVLVLNEGADKGSNSQGSALELKDNPPASALKSSSRSTSKCTLGILHRSDGLNIAETQGPSNRFFTS